MRQRTERGQNLVEFALTLPVLLVILVAVIDLGRCCYSYIAITNASREGARYLSRHPWPEALPSAVGVVSGYAADSGVTLTASDCLVTGIPATPGSYAPDGQNIIVTVRYDFPTIIGSMVGMPTLRMQRSTEMVSFGRDG